MYKCSAYRGLWVKVCIQLAGKYSVFFFNLTRTQSHITYLKKLTYSKSLCWISQMLLFVDVSRPFLLCSFTDDSISSLYCIWKLPLLLSGQKSWIVTFWWITSSLEVCHSAFSHCTVVTTKKTLWCLLPTYFAIKGSSFIECEENSFWKNILQLPFNIIKIWKTYNIIKDFTELLNYFSPQ